MQWPVQAVREALAAVLSGCAVEVVPEIDSSNTELMRRARAGTVAPVLLIAESQTAGRGRLGRGWVSAPGESLTFSLGVTLAPADWSGLSLAVGVAVAESLHPRIRLKWPNDLWVDDRKLAGILIETATVGAAAGGARHAVIGVGVNIAPRPEAGLSTPGIGLAELDAALDAATALERIAGPLAATVRDFEQCGFAPFSGRFAARDALRDREVVLSDGTAGIARGVSGTGALLVHTAAGTKAVSSSEVSVRPAPP